MRFLCLHGRGTNSDIFEAQLTALTSRLSAEHSFDFLDAESPCAAAPGIASLYPAPYLSWHTQGHPEDVQQAHDFLRSVIEEDGPYDGVIGFSEGAALAAGLLLCDDSSYSSPPFKVAILFNSVVPLAPSKTLGLNLSDILGTDQGSYLDLLSGTDAQDKVDESRLSEVFGLSSDVLMRIAIPTLHVIGMKDPFVKSSRAVLDLCQADLAQVLLHDGGHELPRSKAALDRCAELFEMAVSIAAIQEIKV